MNKYTVLLLRPDYMTDNFGQDTYQAWVEAPDPIRAKAFAQQQAFEADRAREDLPALENLEDYFVLAVYAGHIEDLNSGD